MQNAQLCWVFADLVTYYGNVHNIITLHIDIYAQMEQHIKYYETHAYNDIHIVYVHITQTNHRVAR